MAIEALEIPRLMIIVDRMEYASCGEWIRALVAATKIAATRPKIVVQARNKHQDRDSDLRAVEAFDDGATASRLIVNGERRRAAWAGLHWPEACIPQTPPDAVFFRGASVHSEVSLRRAEAAGAHYAVFGPVYDALSKSVRGVGLGALREIVRQATIPILAVGGITKERIAAVLETGAYGVASISAVRDPHHLTGFFCALRAPETSNPKFTEDTP